MPIVPIFLPVPVTNPIEVGGLPELPKVQPPEAPASAPQEPPAPEAVLVAGLAYPEKRGKIRDTFTAYCRVIAPRLRKKYPGGKITAFNFFAGTQEEYQFKKETLVQPVVARNIGKLKAEHYRFYVNQWEFDDQGEEKEKYVIKAPAKDATTMYYPGISDVHPTNDVKKTEYLKAFRDKKLTEVSISIGDVYSHIERIGKNTKGSLVEVHVFSHSWKEGPVLANTQQFREWDPRSNAWRLVNDGKYLDKDGRMEDFDSGYTVVQNMADFKAAFAEKAFTMIWGCNASMGPKQIVRQTRYSKLYKEMLKKPDEKLLELEFNRDWETESEETEADFHALVLDSKDTSGKKSEKKSLNDIKKILQVILDKTYMKKIAVATGRDTLGALPGTGANLDQSYQKEFGLQLMHIPMGRDYNDYIDEKTKTKYFDSRWILKFYQDHLAVGFKPDGEYDKKTYGRGYGVYKP